MGYWSSDCLQPEGIQMYFCSPDDWTTYSRNHKARAFQITWNIPWQRCCWKSQHFPKISSLHPWIGVITQPALDPLGARPSSYGSKMWCVPEHFLRWGASKKWRHKKSEFLWVYQWYGTYRYIMIYEYGVRNWFIPLLSIVFQCFFHLPLLLIHIHSCHSFLSYVF